MIFAIVFDVALAVHNAMPTTCQIIRDAKYISQSYDGLDTTHGMFKRQVPEIGPIYSRFGRRDPYVAFIGAAAVDVVGDFLTRRNPVARCALDAWELQQANSGWLYTNGTR